MNVVMMLLLLFALSPSQGKCMFEKTRAIKLQGGQYKTIQFGNNTRDFKLKGSFEAHGSKIRVSIVDAENLAKLVNFEKFVAYYDTRKARQGEIDVDLSQGNYHLIWWNESTDRTVVIEAEVCFVTEE